MWDPEAQANVKIGRIWRYLEVFVEEGFQNNAS